MRRLAASDKVSDRIVAAGNPSTPLDVLWCFVKDEPEVQVRSWVARNPSTGRTLLWFLTGDPDPGIAAYARFRLDGTG